MLMEVVILDLLMLRLEFNIDFTYSLGATPSTVSVSCGLPAFIVTNVTAGNNSGSSSANSGNIICTLFKEISTGVWEIISNHVPWTSSNTVINSAGDIIGNNTAGTGSGTGSLSGIISTGSSMTGVISIAVPTTTILQNYKLVLHRNITDAIVGDNTNQTLVNDIIQNPCAVKKNFTAICTIPNVILAQPTSPCHSTDLELGYIASWSSQADPSGFIGSYRPSQLSSIQVVVGSTPGLEYYEWVDFGGTVVQTTGPSNVGVSLLAVVPGLYTLNIYANLAQYTAGTILIGQNLNMSVQDGAQETASSFTDCTCNANDGTISGYSVSWADCAGAVNYGLTDNVAQPLTWNDSIDEYEPLDLAGNVISSFSPSSTFTGLSAGVYAVIAYSTCGCAEVSNTITIAPGGNLSPSILVTPAACLGGNNTVTVTMNSGTANFTYTWTSTDANFIAPSTSGTSSTTSSITTTEAHSYTVVVTDNSGCPPVTLTASTVVTPGMSINPVVSNIGCGAPATDGVITTAVTGNTGSVSYQWSGGSSATTASITGVTCRYLYSYSNRCWQFLHSIRNIYNN